MWNMIMHLNYTPKTHQTHSTNDGGTRDGGGSKFKLQVWWFTKKVETKEKRLEYTKNHVNNSGWRKYVF